MKTDDKKRSRDEAEISTPSDDEYTPNNKLTRTDYLKMVKFLTEMEESYSPNGLKQISTESESEYENSDNSDSDYEEDNEEDNEEPEEETLNIFDLLNKMKPEQIEKNNEYYINMFADDIVSVNIDEEQKSKYINDMEKYVNNIFNNRECRIKKILDLNVEDSIKQKIIEELIDIDDSPDSNNKQKSWLNKLLSIPFGTYKNFNINIDTNTPEEIEKFLLYVKEKLDETVFGQENVKEYLLEMIIKKIVNDKVQGQCAALCGPPGIGKTSIIQDGLARALDRPCVSISLAGAKDVSVLTGHSFTYEGSRPGRIVDALIQAKCMNPIIFFDEVDKIDSEDKGLSVIYKLIEIIDYSQNHNFEDSYFSGIPIDLSRVTFIFSLNSMKNINYILLNRIEMIQVKGFDKTEKMNIVKKYLIPQEEKNNNFKTNEIVFKDGVLESLLYTYVNQEDKGIRKIKEIIKNIYRKLSLLRFTSKVSYSYKNIRNDEGKIVMTMDLLRTLMKDTKKNEYLSYYT